MNNELLEELIEEVSTRKPRFIRNLQFCENQSTMNTLTGILIFGLAYIFGRAILKRR